MPTKAVCCPVEVTLKVIGGRWKVLIIHNLLGGAMRFNELQRNLTGITHRTLSRQLREMEMHQLIVRNDFNETPPRVEYSLSPLGHSLKSILFVMDEWGRKYRVGTK
ncbi:MAG: helix-turn-helix transcriptional regulator [Nitrosomonas sp.]|uniref:winged helix-turn-helix transcriptional regulator n=1 Tax=Nitrosomonas sp. TaxID=42353 RepID=UPI001D467F04|nr:helix-turn-helix domain-containing protein [Nitrosomonas sp.]MBX9894108.1 helix-turn-helix transcriptional regulator [Nitrosomonas sp.]